MLIDVDKPELAVDCFAAFWCVGMIFNRTCGSSSFPVLLDLGHEGTWGPRVQACELAVTLRQDEGSAASSPLCVR